MSHTLVLENGDCVAIHPENGDTLNLKEMYRHLECDMVQFIEFGECLMICDEEAKLTDREVNQQATDRVAQYLPWFLGAGHTEQEVLKSYSFADTINGPAIIVEGADAFLYV